MAQESFPGINKVEARHVIEFEPPDPGSVRYVRFVSAAKESLIVLSRAGAVEQFPLPDLM